jgi:predicted  nucleic acid-binding Zn-ribbon protein
VNAQTGTFRCTGCGYLVSLTATDALPECPSCGGGEFARASLFTGSPTLVGEPMAEVEDGGWLAALRDGA